MAIAQSNKVGPFKAIQDALGMDDETARALSGTGPLGFSGMANSPSQVLAALSTIVQDEGGKLYLEVHFPDRESISFEIDTEGYAEGYSNEHLAE